MPKKIRELKVMLSKAGFICLPKRGKGSHSIWEHRQLSYNVALAGQDGDDAKRYQEKDVRNAIRDLQQQQEEDDGTTL